MCLYLTTTYHIRLYQCTTSTPTCGKMTCQVIPESIYKRNSIFYGLPQDLQSFTNYKTPANTKNPSNISILKESLKIPPSSDFFPERSQ